MPSSTEVAQSNFKAAQPLTGCFLKCPTLTELYLSSVCGEGQRLGAHARFCGTKYCLLPILLSFVATNTATGRCGREGDGGRSGTWWPSRDTTAEAQHSDLLAPGPSGGGARGMGAAPGLACLVRRGRHRGEKSTGRHGPPLRILLPSGWEGTVGARVCRGGCLVLTPRAGRTLSPGRKHTRCSWSRSCHRQDHPARGRRRRCQWRSRRPCGSRPRRVDRRLARGS